MTKHTDDMSTVADWGEAVPEGWYHARIAKAEEGISEESSQPKVTLHLKIQEEPLVGRVVVDNASLQPHALAKLKAYYVATGQGILPEGGHDPELLLDGECYINVMHETYKGQTRAKVPPWGIKSLAEGKPV